MTINFIGDFVLLAVMIYGVLHKRNATHLWNMLYVQGLFWILAAILTELPSVVCLFFRNVAKRPSRRLTVLYHPGTEFQEYQRRVYSERARNVINRVSFLIHRCLEHG
jgi:hypothetical protein